MASLFTKIIQGNIPSYKVFEDEHTFAFLDINPVQLGHTLVVPKVEVDHFIDVPDPYYSAVFTSGKIIGQALQKATGCKRVGSIILGFDVPHFHLHLIPIDKPSDLDLKLGKPHPDEEMKDILDRIKKELWP